MKKPSCTAATAPFFIAPFLTGWVVAILAVTTLFTGCAETEIIETPKTAYVADTGTAKEPELIWTSRNIERPFDYLGQIKARAWTYDGALERLKTAGKELRADAVVDIHFERLGFFKTMHAFAIKFKQ